MHDSQSSSGAQRARFKFTIELSGSKTSALVDVAGYNGVENHEGGGKVIVR